MSDAGPGATADGAVVPEVVEPRRRGLLRLAAWSGLIAGAMGVAAYFGAPAALQAYNSVEARPTPPTRARPASDGSFVPTSAQWTSLTVEPVAATTFRAIIATDGRIAIDEDNTTPVFSPYTGRILSLHAKAGDKIEAGQPLFTIAASDMVQAQNDLMTAIAAVNKATSGSHLAEINLTRARNLYDVRAGSQRDFQSAEDAFAATTNDRKAAEAALEAVGNRMRLLGKTDQEIAKFEKEGRIGSETIIRAPLSGTVVQRKAGPGQYVTGASSDPVFVIGDLSKVWVVANVKETDTPAIKVGQPIDLRVMALPDRRFTAKIGYVGTLVDPATRRLAVRAQLDNADGLLKPEMFTMVSIVTSSEQSSPSIPRSALIYEGEDTYVWAMQQPERALVKRKISVGNATSERVEVLSGLTNGESVVTRGSLFIDRLARAD